MSASPAVRSLRAALFAGVCVLLAVAGHRLATGTTPPVWADGAGFLGVFLTGWLLGGRERSLVGIGAVMLATQAGLHLAFEVAEPRAATAELGMNMAGMHGRSMAAHGHTLSVLAGAALAHLHTMSTPATAAHVLAALVTSWWLRRGEAALWSLLRSAVAHLPALAAWRRTAPTPLPTAAGPLHRSADTTPLRRLLLRHAVRRRGPPAWIPYAI